MKATKEYYLKNRNAFLFLGYNEEVRQLDIHFGIILIYNKHNQLIHIL
jgi:hypothetical protein